MKDVYLIKNAAVVGPLDIDDRLTRTDKNGNQYFIDDYGMGANHWSIITHPDQAYERQMQDNVLWASDRLAWAKKNNITEVDTLLEIVATNGASRNTEYYRKLKREK